MSKIVPFFSRIVFTFPFFILQLLIFVFICFYYDLPGLIFISFDDFFSPWSINLN